jgi:8-oxo-dGTP pyrophosphatase MutT (NUDIX family)/phosphohistidine phosphatase SixA
MNAPGIKIVEAAGGIVWRRSAIDRTAVEVLLVHRPNYKDWTFPKGKAEAGEPIAVTAVREIEEETGMPVRLGHPLPEVTYRVRGGIKRVRYWCAQPTGDTGFTPNREIDKLKWVSVREADKKLTYEHDVALLGAFEDLVAKKLHRTRTLVLLRHAKAVSRGDFGGQGGDWERPLAAAGAARSGELVGLLLAFGVRTVISSPARRCLETVEPFAVAAGRRVQTEERLAEGSTLLDVADAVAVAVSKKNPVVLCSHRPTFPEVYAALHLTGPVLAPGQGLVVHHRRGKVVASELL